MTNSISLSMPQKEGERRHGYYRRDLENLLAFIVPNDVKTVRVRSEEFPAEKSDYIVMVNTINSASDIGALFDRAHGVLSDDGRLVLTYHNRLWKPFFAIAAALRLRTSPRNQNWFSDADIRNLLDVSDFKIVRSGRRMLLPIYIPLISTAMNWIGHVPLINRLCLTNYIIARPIPKHREYSVSVIVPARNEEGNIRPIIERMPNFGTSLELIFIEGNSKDGTWRAIQDAVAAYSGPMKVRAAQQDGRGKADAVRKGFTMASGEIVMILDADITVAPEDLPKFYEAIARGKADFVNGSRLVYPMEKGAMRFLNTFGNMFFAAILSWLIDQRLKDALCGTKALFKKDYELIEKNRAFFGDFDSFGDFDLLLGAVKRNLKLCDLPVRYRERSYGTTNIHRFSHGWQLLKMCAFAARRMKFF